MWIILTLIFDFIVSMLRLEKSLTLFLLIHTHLLFDESVSPLLSLVAKGSS